MNTVFHEIKRSASGVFSTTARCLTLSHMASLCDYCIYYGVMNMLYYGAVYIVGSVNYSMCLVLCERAQSKGCKPE